MSVSNIILLTSVILFLLAFIFFLLFIICQKQFIKYKQLLKKENKDFDALTATKKNLGNDNEDNNISQYTWYEGADPLGLARDIDCSQLFGKYELEKEIGGGGMSRTFIARHATLGNKWIVKYISGTNRSMQGEENVLKSLNHINLPQIIDVFYTPQGTFLVESFIEGCTLDEVLKTGETINQRLLCDWGIQMAQVLSYLHNQNPAIIHCDIKPKNIMVTYNNKLVLIDFGISIHGNTEKKAKGMSLWHAAPEQFTYTSNVNVITAARQRFGCVPDFGTQGKYIDKRTDIYSLGIILYQIATGALPMYSTYTQIQNMVSPQLANIILKCIQFYPENRYQTAEALCADLEKAKGNINKMFRYVKIRKPCAIAALLMGLMAITSGVYGYHIGQEDKTTTISISQVREANIDYPGLVTVTADAAEYLNQYYKNKNMKITESNIIESNYNDKFSSYSLRLDVTVDRLGAKTKHKLKMRYVLENKEWILVDCTDEN